MEFFDRDDLKKALVYLLPVLAVVIIIVFAARLPSSDKKDDSSSKAYSYGSSEMPFSMTIVCRCRLLPRCSQPLMKTVFLRFLKPDFW